MATAHPEPAGAARAARLFRSLALALALLALWGAPAAAENPEDKVYLTFMQHPVAGVPVEYGVRNLCGNTCTRASSELKADGPMSGDTKRPMKRLNNWCYSNGKVTFAKPGPVQVLVNVNVHNANNNFYFQDRITMVVQPAGEAQP